MIRSNVFAGAAARAEARFLDPETNVPEDVQEPVVFDVRFPGEVGSTTPGELRAVPGTRLGVGHYMAVFTTTLPGRYVVRARSAGSYPAVAWDELNVRASAV